MTYGQYDIANDLGPLVSEELIHNIVDGKKTVFLAVGMMPHETAISTWNQMNKVILLTDVYRQTYIRRNTSGASRHGVIVPGPRSLGGSVKFLK